MNTTEDSANNLNDPFSFHRYCRYCSTSCTKIETDSNLLLITNIWNEQDNIGKLFKRISEQTKKPKVWLWIDDGSTDESVNRIQMLADSIHGVEIWIETMPSKRVGNLDTIGRAYHATLPRLRDRIDRVGIDYVSIVDVDNHPCPNYFARMIWLMDDNPEVGAASGLPTTEIGMRKAGLPMGGGKMIRWKIMRDVTQYWDIAPDTLLNIKALSKGYKLKIWKVPLKPDAPTAAFSSKGVFRQGRLSYYVGRPFWGVLMRSIRRLLLREHGAQMLRGYLFERQRGVWRFNDPDVLRFYNRGTNPISALIELLSFIGNR